MAESAGAADREARAVIEPELKAFLRSLDAQLQSEHPERELNHLFTKAFYFGRLYSYINDFLFGACGIPAECAEFIVSGPEILGIKVNLQELARTGFQLCKVSAVRAS